MRDPPASARLANAASVIWAKDEPEGQSDVNLETANIFAHGVQSAFP